MTEKFRKLVQGKCSIKIRRNKLPQNPLCWCGEWRKQNPWTESRSAVGLCASHSQWRNQSHRRAVCDEWLLMRLKFRTYFRSGHWILSLVFLCHQVTVLAQSSVSITGQVVDQNGEGLLGVTVQIEGTTTGSITDLQGNFSLNTQVGQTLIFSIQSLAAASVQLQAHPGFELTQFQTERWFFLGATL